MEDTIIKALLLGYAHIECNGTPIRICLKKAQGLLFYLLVHKKATRDELTGLLWGGEDNELARRHLRDNLYHLKKVVPIELVVPAGRSAIQLNPELGFYIDVDEFLKAVDVEAYQGEFLKGFSVPNCYEYEEWLERTRTSLREAYLQQLDKRAEFCLSEGKDGEAEALWRKYLQEEPLCETVSISLMRFYRAQKDYNRAALIYRGLHKAMADTLGIAPLKDTSELYYSIMKEWNEQSENGEISDDFLVGRQNQLQYLLHLFSRMHTSKHARSFVILGEAGVGKTHLLSYFLSHGEVSSYEIITTSCFKSKQDEYLYPWQTMVTAASGAGKTAFFLYPNIEYALASGMSFLCTDTKGDLFRNYAGIAKDCYGYQIAVLDLRNPTRSDGNNLLHLINKYMDIYKADPKNLAAKAKAEKYSKILAKTLINTSGGESAQYGQNAFFYDSAEGLLTAMFLLVAEYLPTEDADGNPIEKRHIVSVFKLVQELLAPSRVKGKNQFQLLLEKLPPNHKARWFAGSALNTAEQAMASVISTVLSRLNAFLDSEMEQILCFDTAIDAEKFCNEKSAIFIVLPEEDQTKYFMVSLILQNLYREILTVADENGGRLKNRVVFFADELGTCPPIQSLELMFSASRSRGLMLVPIVQSITGQLQKNYGKEGSEIIVDNCQVNLYGGFAPASQTAVELSKSLGSRTVMSGSISRGKNDPSQSLQMMERPLMTPDELKSMPKGSFIVAKTGVHPMKVKLRLFLDWGIRFRKPYEVPEKAQRSVAYADKQELEESIIRRHYGTIVMDSEQPQGGGTSAGGIAQGIQAAPDSRKTVFRP